MWGTTDLEPKNISIVKIGDMTTKCRVWFFTESSIRKMSFKRHYWDNWGNQKMVCILDTIMLVLNFSSDNHMVVIEDMPSPLEHMVKYACVTEFHG